MVSAATAAPFLFSLCLTPAAPPRAQVGTLFTEYAHVLILVFDDWAHGAQGGAIHWH